MHRVVLGGRQLGIDAGSEQDADCFQQVLMLRTVSVWQFVVAQALKASL